MQQILSAEFLVKYGLPIILFFLFLAVIISIVVIKLVLKEPYLKYVTECLVENFYGDMYELVRVREDAVATTSQQQQQVLAYERDRQFVNVECYNIRIDASSRFIQIPYLIRFLSLIVFWGYFCIQILCLKEIFTDSDKSDEADGLVCFNVSSKIVGHYYRCEKYGFISLEDILDNMDQFAGILTLNEINRYVFKFSYRFFAWSIPQFRKYHGKLKSITAPDHPSIPLVSYAQINYLIIIAYLSFSIYENFTKENHFVPVKFVCYSTLVYSTVLCAYETVKLSVVAGDQVGDNTPIMISFGPRVTRKDDVDFADPKRQVNPSTEDLRAQLIVENSSNSNEIDPNV